MDKLTIRNQHMYNKYRFGNFSYNNSRLNFNPLFIKFIKHIPKEAVVTDIGSGKGFWIKILVNSGHKLKKIVAVDISPRNVSELKKQGFKAFCQDASSLKLKTNSTDFTISEGVIHHTSDPFVSFSELVRITKPNGLIYLNVYNALNPYFFFVHTLTFPFRFIYWNITKKIVFPVYLLSQVLVQPLSLIVFKKFLDRKTHLTLLMDQVFTPTAKLFTKGKVLDFAKRTNCQVKIFQYNRFYLMLSAIIKVKKTANASQIKHRYSLSKRK